MNRLNHITTLAMAALMLLPCRTAAQDTMRALLESIGVEHSDGTTHYTKEHPLIYEGALELPPYSFLNVSGEPDGFDVELIKMVLAKLDIPYEIKLKPRMKAIQDLKDGHCDLMIELTAGFKEGTVHYGQTSITLFTQSVLSPIKTPTTIHEFQDLATHKVYVNDSSLCHHLMIDYGWGDNAMPTRNIAETIKQMDVNERGEMVWNTLSLQWMQRKYKLDNLEITPINMPHGEYRFLSKDEQLLHRIDSVYAELFAAEQLVPLQNRWFYPNQNTDTAMPRWMWYVYGGGAPLLLLLLVYIISYRIQARRINEKNERLNRRLALILETSTVHIWTYDVRSEMFTWRNEMGQPAFHYTPEEFSKRYTPEDYSQLHDALTSLAGHQGTDATDITLRLKAKDVESGTNEERDYIIVLSVLERDRHGNTKTIIGTKKDITNILRNELQTQERNIRYLAIFNTPLVGILLFNKDRCLTNINSKACDILECGKNRILAAKVNLNALLDLPADMDIDQLDGMHATHYIDLDNIPASKRHVPQIMRTGILSIEYYLLAVRDDEGKAVDMFVVCRDTTSSMTNRNCKMQKRKEIAEQQAMLDEYDRTLDNVLQDNDIRLVSYSPATHRLMIYSSANKVQRALTQTRCMSLVDSSSKKTTMHLLAKMDSAAATDIDVNIVTSLRAKGGLPLCVKFILSPRLDRKGNVIEYTGLCRDFTEMHHLNKDIEARQAKIKDIDDMKNKFMKDTVNEILAPMSIVRESVAALNSIAPTADEPTLTARIDDNASKLKDLTQNILLLSYIETKMQQSDGKPHDLAQDFGRFCNGAWDKYSDRPVEHILVNDYEMLVLDANTELLGQAIHHIVLNAAQHTTKGSIRARYMYMGGRLLVAVDDTGSGMAPDKLNSIRRQISRNRRADSGIGLSICSEIVSQMGGTMDIYSEEGKGTSVYLTIPCHATEVKLKRTLERQKQA